MGDIEKTRETDDSLKLGGMENTLADQGILAWHRHDKT